MNQVNISIYIPNNDQDISEESHPKLANSNWVDKLTLNDDSIQFNYSGSRNINQEAVQFQKSNIYHRK